MPEIAFEDTLLLAAYAAHHGVTVSLEVKRGLPSADRLSYVNRLAVMAGTLARNSDENVLENSFRVFVANVKAADAIPLCTIQAS
jgi:hypothetical protein